MFLKKFHIWSVPVVWVGDDGCDYPEETHYFLFKRSAKKFFYLVNKSKHYYAYSYSCESVWNWCGKIEFPEGEFEND